MGNKCTGMFIEKDLKFDSHINKIINTANCTMGNIQGSCRFLKRETFLKLYKVKVRLQLDYTNTGLGN